ncbi:MAG: class I SAM-dependent methyltransferase [Candidatus Kryptoniota bacterium]
MRKHSFRLHHEDLFELEAEAVPPYTESAAIYDHMMREVDYKSWAKYIMMLMKLAGVETRRSKIKGQRLCEFACGTGNLSLILHKFGYDITGIDNSKRMLLQAQSKIRHVGHSLKRSAQFINHDMLTYRSPKQFDAMVCVYDSINYVSDKDSVKKFLGNAFSNLKPGGVFILDASLESNSLNDPSLFIQRGRCGGIHYQRRSLYDRKTKTHTTQIRIKREGKLFEEVHQEHIFTLDTLHKLAAGKGFIEKFAAGDFTMLEADDSSERVHFVLVKPRIIERHD